MKKALLLLLAHCKLKKQLTKMLQRLKFVPTTELYAECQTEVLPVFSFKGIPYAAPPIGCSGTYRVGLAYTFNIQVIPYEAIKILRTSIYNHDKFYR